MFFGSSKPNISRREFERELMMRLRARGFSDIEKRDIKKIFRGDLDEEHNTQQGIDANEVERGIRWMRENTSEHSLSSEEIDELEKILKEFL